MEEARAKKEPTEEFLNGKYGFFPEECRLQPEIPELLQQLGESVLEIHLNDCVPYQCVAEMITHWEGVVPGRVIA